MPRIPLIIDCDPGEDDTVAILMMAGDSRFDIRGITPVCGNKELPLCEKNALRICELIRRTGIPVAKGARQSLLRGKRTALGRHGATGLGTVVLPEPQKTADDASAWDLIYNEAKRAGGELEILAIGPLTNLAVALTKYPELASGMIRKVSVMGGASGAGNFVPAAEFNIWSDPEAAKIVLSSGLDIAMFGLDICRRAYVTPDDLGLIQGDGSRIHAVAAELIGLRVERGRQRGAPGGILCDAVAAAYLMDPSLFSLKRCHVDVETKGELTLGKTVVDWGDVSKKAPNVAWGVGLDREGFIRCIVTALDTLEPPKNRA